MSSLKCSCCLGDKPTRVIEEGGRKWRKDNLTAKLIFILGKNAENVKTLCLVCLRKTSECSDFMQMCHANLTPQPDPDEVGEPPPAKRQPCRELIINMVCMHRAM